MPSRMQQKKPCFAWQRGDCRNGDACQYSHDGPQGQGSGNSGSGFKKPCFNFAKGMCRFGDQCRYFHDPAKAPTGNGMAASSNSGYNYRPPTTHKTTGSNGVAPIPEAPTPAAMPSLSKPSMPPPASLAVEAVPMTVPFRAAPAKKGKGNPFKKRKTKKKAAAEDLFDL